MVVGMLLATTAISVRRFRAARASAAAPSSAHTNPAEVASTTVAFADVSGWDTHAGEGGAQGQLANNLRNFSDAIAAFRGLAQRSPILALCMLLFLLSLGGIPFVAGFWAKLFVFWAAAEQGLYWLVLVGAVWLLYGLGPAGADPLGPDAPLAFVFSPLVGTPRTAKLPSSAARRPG